jgi:hypothetical protein
VSEQSQQQSQTVEQPVIVKGPDGKTYKFPQGTDKAKAVQYFKSKGITAAVQPADEKSNQDQSLLSKVDRRGQPQTQIPRNYGFTPGNMLTNFHEGVNAAAKGTYEMGKDLLSNPNWFKDMPAGQRPSTAQKFVYDPADEQTAKMKESYRNGRLLEAAGHGLAAALPILGPTAANLAEQAGHGDIGGATGQVAGMYAFGKTSKLAIDSATGLVDPEALRTRAAKLNTKVLKQADAGVRDYKMSAALQVAQEGIVATAKSLPGKIEQVRAAKNASVIQATQAADAAGVVVDISNEVKPIVRDIAQISSARGQWTAQLRNQISSLMQRVTTQLDPRTGGTMPRDLSKLKVSDALQLEKGLEDLSAFGKEPPAAINNLARRIRGALNDKLPPDIQRLRGEESRLIIARDAARENYVKILNDKSSIGRGILYSGAGTIGVYLGLRALGTMPMAAIGSVVMLRALATSTPSRTFRAALYARAASMLDGATMANAAPTAGAAGQTPTGGPLVPKPVQPTQNKALTGVQAPPFASASVVSTNPPGAPNAPTAPPAPIPLRLPASLGRSRTTSNYEEIQPSTRTGTDVGTDVPFNSGESRQGGPAKAAPKEKPLSKKEVSDEAYRKLTWAVAEYKADPSAANKAELDRLDQDYQDKRSGALYGGRYAKTSVAESNTKNAAMMGRLDTLLERQASPKNAMDRAAIDKEITELKRLIAGENVPGATKRIADRERLAAKRADAAASATPQASGAGGEAVSQAASPEMRSIALDAGYKKLASYEGGPEMVKALQSTAKAMQKVDPHYDEVEKLTEALEALRELDAPARESIVFR